MEICTVHNYVVLFATTSKKTNRHVSLLVCFQLIANRMLEFGGCCSVVIKSKRKKTREQERERKRELHKLKIVGYAG